MRVTVETAPAEPKTVTIRGWTFARMESGMVGIKKEPLVHGDILLGEDEWDKVVSTLWQASEDDADAVV